MYTQKDYRNLIKKINIYEKEVIRKNLKHGFFIIHGSYDKKDVLVKAVSKKEKDKVKSMEKEISVNQILQNKFKKIFIGTKVIKVGQNKDFVWIIRDYYEGESLANSEDKNEIICGYDKLQKKYLSYKTTIIKQVIKNLNLLRKIDINTFKAVPFFEGKYKIDLEKYYLSDIENGIQYDINKSVNYYNKIKKDFFNKDNVKANIGDLNPSNVIITKEIKVLFADFEWFSFDNYMMDLSFFWLFLWRYPDWQKEFLEKAINNNSDKLFFLASIIRQIIGWYDHIYRNDRLLTSNVISDRINYKNHIWTKYLIAAGESFDAIIKVSND